MAVFYNQASLSFMGSVTNSNITEGELSGGLEVSKTVVTADYAAGDSVTYLITLENDGIRDINDVSVTDNLGRYTPSGSILEVVPLDYITGSVRYYQNGVLQAAPAVAVTDGALVISGITVLAGGNATIVYQTRVNSFAPLEAASVITNTASVVGCGEQTDSASVSARSEAHLTIAKSISPAVITCNGEVSYTFVIQNTGNIAAGVDEALSVSDTFVPALSDISVTVNGDALVEGVGYTYDELTGEFRTADGAVTVAAATYVRDAVSGAVTVTPGFTVIVVTGTI